MRRFFNIQDHAGAQLEMSPHFQDHTANHGQPVVANRQLITALNRAHGDQLRLTLDSSRSNCFISHTWRNPCPFKCLTPAYVSSNSQVICDAYHNPAVALQRFPHDPGHTIPIYEHIFDPSISSHVLLSCCTRHNPPNYLTYSRVCINVAIVKPKEPAHHSTSAAAIRPQIELQARQTM